MIACHNHQAIGLLANSQYDEAIRIWKDDITFLKNNVWRQHGGARDDMFMLPNDQETTAVKIIESHRLPKNSNIGQYDFQELFQFYGQPFVVSSFINEIPSINDRYTVMTAIILYNLGLSHHLQCLSTGREPTSTSTGIALLKKAMKYYGMSLKILDTLPDHFVHQFLIGQLILANVNNLGYIHSCFYNVNEMQRCRELVFSFYSEVMDSLRATASNMPYNHQLCWDFVQFFSFSVLLLQQSLVTAPSA
jgi:hypothetical protein